MKPYEVKNVMKENERLEKRVKGLETENRALKKAASKRGRKEFRRQMTRTAKEAQKKRKPTVDKILEKPFLERVKVAIQTGGAIIAGKRGAK